MITNDLSGHVTTYYGKSTDIKPSVAFNGSTYFEIDTCKVFMFDEDTHSWKELE